jgi:hypothetical protein
MKIRRIALLNLLLPAALAVAQSRVPEPVAVSGNDALLQSIRNASDPSATIEAYSRGLAADGADPLAIRQAYVGRMVDLGAPELADAQAHDLIKRGAADALIAGTAAYNDAVRGNVHSALENLKLAVTYSPRDSFLLRTAGQVVAWYDSQAGQTDLSREDAASMEWLRAAGNGSQEFKETHDLVIQARQAQNAQTAVDRQSAAAQASAPAQSTGAQAAGTRAQAATNSSQAQQQYSSDGSGQTNSSYTYYYYPYSSSGSYYTGYSGYYYPYASYGYYGSASIISLRDGVFNRDVAALERSGAAGGILRGPGGDLRNFSGLPGNPGKFPGGGVPPAGLRPGNGGSPPSSVLGQAPRPPTGLDRSPLGRPPAPQAFPQTPPRPPSPPPMPRPPMPPGPPHP